MADAREHRPAGTGRLQALDTLRGAMLIMMAINHIPVDLQRLTNHPFGFVSAAEGFVFLSGLLVGIVYGRRALTRGLRETTSALIKRVFVLYRAHMASVLGVFCWVLAFRAWVGQPPPGAPAVFSERPIASLLATATFLHRPGLLDILPLYCALMLLVPLVLQQLMKGRQRQVLGLSAAVWLLTNIFDSHTPFAWGLINTGAFNLGAWQFLFVIAVSWGYAAMRGRPVPMPSRWALLALLAVTAFLFAWRHFLIDVGLSWDEREWWTNKNNLMVVRALNVAIILYLTALSAKRWPRAFSVGPLSLLGRNSLPVFSAHVVLVTIILGMPQFFEHTLWGRWLAPCVLVGLMYLTAWLAERRARGARPFTPGGAVPAAPEAGATG